MKFDPNTQVPLWLVIASFVLSIISAFWTKIKSTFEIVIKGKTDVSIKKVEHELTSEQKREDAELKKAELDREKYELLQKQIRRLEKSNTALSSVVLFMIDKYEKSNPDDKTVIEQAKRLIKENLYAED